MTTLVHDPKDGDLVAIVYRNDDGRGWLAEVQRRSGTFALVPGTQQRTVTRWGARLAAVRALRRVARVSESKANPILVARA